MNAEEDKHRQYLGFIQRKHERTSGLKQLHLNKRVGGSCFHLKGVVIAGHKRQTRRVTSDVKHIYKPVCHMGVQCLDFQSHICTAIAHYGGNFRHGCGFSVWVRNDD